MFSDYHPVIPLLMLTYSPRGAACDVTSKKSSALTLTRLGAEEASKPQNLSVKSKSTTPV